VDLGGRLELEENKEEGGASPRSHFCLIWGELMTPDSNGNSHHWRQQIVTSNIPQSPLKTKGNLFPIVIFRISFKQNCISALVFILVV
jgi:hypothetical protein